MSWLICPRAFAEEGTPGNFKNPIAVQEVLAGKRTVANAAWWGFDNIDSTKAVQSAINSGATKVIIPYVGREWVVRPIRLVSDQEIVFEPGVVLLAKRGSFKDKNDCLLSALDANNITLRGYGATLRMNKNDYTGLQYKKGEWRHTIRFWGCSNIKILGLKLEDAGGDGIYIGHGTNLRPCRNILIRDCICDGCYRQGISVTSVDMLLVDNCIIRNTRGTPPESGIDLEPNVYQDRLANVVVSNCVAENNAGSGFIASISNLTRDSRNVSILYVNCYAKDCGQAGLNVRAVNENGPSGLIEYKNCTVEDTTRAGARVIWKLASPIKLRFADCKWRNVAKKIGDEPPVHLTLKRRKQLTDTGGVEFSNCYVYDSQNRPFLKITNVKGGEGLYDVKGDITVFNRYGARTEFRKTGNDWAVRVKHFATGQ